MVGEFTAIDLETANPNAFSICQIGIARYKDGRLADEWMSYIDPEARFNRDNIAVHGITAAAVRGCPKLPEVAENLHGMLDGRIVVSHSQFDRIALEQAFDRCDIPRLDCKWLDSTKIAQRAWSGFAGGASAWKICVGSWDTVTSGTTPWATPRLREWSSLPPCSRRGSASTGGCYKQKCPLMRGRVFRFSLCPAPR